MVVHVIRSIIHNERSPGFFALVATALALIAANSSFNDLYQSIFNPSIRHLIDEGPMVLFFLVVSLEIKHALVRGDLSRPSQAALPAVAAIGGMLIPALIYLAVNFDQPENYRGWGIPTATDIAFSLAIATLAGKSVSAPLKLFLASLAVIDDLGAVIIIAFFYAGDLNCVWLGLSALGIGGLVVLNRMNAPAWAFGIGLCILWVCLSNSGIHVTLAGVAVGLAFPAKRALKLGWILSVPVNYLVVPLFILANAGVSLAGITPSILTNGLFLGIFLGLFFGKQIGVMAAAWLMVAFSPAKLPEGSNWRTFHGVAVLTGIGFTMSLFIGERAFPGSSDAVEIRMGVLAASFLSAIVGFGLLLLAGKSVKKPEAQTKTKS